MNKFPADFYNQVFRHKLIGCHPKQFLDENSISPEVIEQMGIGSINDSGTWFLFMQRKHYTEDFLREYGIIVGEGMDKHSFFTGPSVLIPYYDSDGETLIGVESRYVGHLIKVSTPEIQAFIDRIAAEAPKQQFAPGSDCSIYNMEILKTLAPDDELIVCDDALECLRLLSQGKKAIAINANFIHNS